MEHRKKFPGGASEDRQEGRTIKKILFGLVLLAGLFSLIFYWSDIRAAIGSSAGSKKEKKKSEENTSVEDMQSGNIGVAIVKKWDMPDILKEISGLTYLNGDRFACVQDELGTIFIYNTGSEKVEKEIPFAGPGDYEGLAVVGEAIWVVRADGHLFEVTNVNTGRSAVKEYDTHLTVKHNVEGLCYDDKNNRLLLAIKDDEPGNPGYKGIYAFDLKERRMPPEPAFKLDLGHEMLSAGSGKKKNAGIKPTGITIHPVTRELYITDGPSGKLLVTDASGSIKKLYKLDKREFPQPEGIIFKSTSELFISNEGVKQVGNIVKVKLDAD